jgi:hypothetical protein
VAHSLWVSQFGQEQRATIWATAPPVSFATKSISPSLAASQKSPTYPAERNVLADGGRGAPARPIGSTPPLCGLGGCGKVSSPRCRPQACRCPAGDLAGGESNRSETPGRSCWGREAGSEPDPHPPGHRRRPRCTGKPGGPGQAGVPAERRCGCRREAQMAVGVALSRPRGPVWISTVTERRERVAGQVALAVTSGRARVSNLRAS